MSDEAVHYKSMFTGGAKESPYMYACHLGFKDRTLTIARVEPGEVKGTDGKASGKPIIHWQERGERPFALNKTNGKTIVALYGSPNVKTWIGKRITLYPTTTTFGSETVECVRIRPIIPPAPAGSFDLDGTLAEIHAADNPVKFAAVRAWLNDTVRPPPKYKAQIKDALDARAKQNDIDAQMRATRTDEPDREPGSSDDE